MHCSSESLLKNSCLPYWVSYSNILTDACLVWQKKNKLEQFVGLNIVGLNALN